MKLPKVPFFNVIHELLHGLLFQGECNGYAELAVSDTMAQSLVVPPDAAYALIVAEADPTVVHKEKLLRFLETGNLPDAVTGMPLGHLGVYEVKGRENMARFAVIGIEPGKIHTVRIQFFG